MVASFTWSQGFHAWVPLPNSMALAISEKGREGKTLGMLGAASAVGSVVALLVAIFLNREGVSIRPMWFIAGAACLLAGAACTKNPRDIRAPGARLIIRKQYGLFYLLQFLEGWRKQIFIAFASFMLVKQYGTPIGTMLWLFLGANALSWFAAPLVGRCIDRFGERAVLLFYYTTMIVVFACYATVKEPRILYVLFIGDSVLFACTMALTTYIGRLAPSEEQTATLSAGVAANHVASVIMPLVGGTLWANYGYQWAFYAGAVMATMTLIPVMFIGPRKATPQPQEA
jgi:MFS family permease